MGGGVCSGSVDSKCASSFNSVLNIRAVSDALQFTDTEQNNVSDAVLPVYEFRPLPSDFTGTVRRYADGKWIEDDGEYDLAFIGVDKGFPICLMFEPPYQKNIRWKWLTTHWSWRVEGHPKGNAWHYMLADRARTWGGDWGSRDHENRQVGSKGMGKMSSETGCSNGRHVEFHLGNPHIEAGLLRIRDTKEIVRFPETPVCMYCGTDWRPQPVTSQIDSQHK